MGAMIRWLFLLHRYLGIAVGLLMAMWCGSGVVMMYASYPELDESSRLQHLTPIKWDGCCKISDQVLTDDDPVSGFQIEMLAGRPVVHLRSGAGRRLIDLATGSPINGVSLGQAAAVARPYAADAQSPSPRLLDMIDYDQWTVSGEFRADRPLYHFSFGDDKGIELYVSSTTGHAVQVTTARERFWNWLGSVPHWLYFAELRHRPSLWSQIVIYTSLIGCFLAATGLYIGLRQLVRRPGLWSPYHGFNLWHHIAGLVFGVFTLTWVLSGLLSMNPWSLLEASGSETERARLNGASQPSGAQIKAAVQAMAILQPADLLSIRTAPLNGEVYFIVNTADGNRRRLNAAMLAAPLNKADLAYIAGALSAGVAASVPLLLTEEDSYYFSHHRDRVSLPVYRMVLHDGSATRYYIDAVSGMLTAKIDRSARAYRWLHEGLHRLDFTAALRGRPQWDALMLLLMSGVTTVCATGAYLGYRRLLRRRTPDGVESRGR
jgi:PepSY-associated TM region